jgi:hypothetical protein
MVKGVGVASMQKNVSGINIINDFRFLNTGLLEDQLQLNQFQSQLAIELESSQRTLLSQDLSSGIK